MDMDRLGQKWILDAFLSSTGLDVLHPGAGAVFEQLGYHRLDIEQVFSSIKSARMLPGAWAQVAQKNEARAIYWENRKCPQASRAMYERAMLLYGRAYYSLQDNIDIRMQLLTRMKRCFQKAASFIPTPVRHIELPFEGGKLNGIFSTGFQSQKAPCVILIPGMDMFKEDWHVFMQKHVVPRGWIGFALDCPGQGESRASGLKTETDNGDRAISAVVDWLIQQPEVDPNRIVLMGTSMGAWWASRGAAAEKRISAAAVAMVSFASDRMSALSTAQPSFSKNLKFMTGITDAEGLIAFARKMKVDDVLPAIKCPYLMVFGEYDELSNLDLTQKVFDLIKSPKELWIYGNQFHSLGPTSNEWLPACLDWLDLALQGNFPSSYIQQVFIEESGQFRDGASTPEWWHDKFDG